MTDKEKLIEVPDVYWVTEIIEERFDNALSFMTENSIVYGGAVRDAIAGLPLLGDLDIAVKQSDFGNIVKNIRQNPRWIVKDPEMQKKLAESYQDKIETSVISDVVSFENNKERVIQIITPGVDPKGNAISELTMARKVDILCCSLVLTPDGRVFETIEGAADDCKKRIIRINENAIDILDYEHLITRTRKLLDRGWTNEIDLDSLRKEMERRKELRREKDKREIIFTSMDEKEFHKCLYASSVSLELLKVNEKSKFDSREQAIEQIVDSIRKKRLSVIVRLKSTEGVLQFNSPSSLEIRIVDDVVKSVLRPKISISSLSEKLFTGSSSRYTSTSSYNTSTSSTGTSTIDYYTNTFSS